MDVSKILAELREERHQIEEAISSLERLAHGRGKRRGRPPAWMSDDTCETSRSSAGKQEQGNRGWCRGCPKALQSPKKSAPGSRCLTGPFELTAPAATESQFYLH